MNTGDYLAQFDATLGSAADITFHGDSFICPFLSSYIDGREIFAFCTGDSGFGGYEYKYTPYIPYFGDALLSDPDRIGTDPLHDLGTLVAGDTAAFTI